jgi:GNAT superfamily N-acetyltransferase
MMMPGAEPEARPAGGGDAERIDRLMREAFPAEERSTAEELLELAERGLGEVTVYFSAGEFCGFSCTIRSHGLCFLYYLAVQDSFRGKGLGSRILRRLCENAGAPIVLNIESLRTGAGNDGQRLRRLRFYEAAGFRSRGFYLLHEGVEYSILCSRPELDTALYRKLLIGISDAYRESVII